MAIAFFDTPTFPDNVAYGTAGGPRFSTTIARVRSGREVRDAKWLYPLHEYDAASGIRVPADLEATRSHFYVAMGRASGWRFKDWVDYKSVAADAAVTHDDQDLGVGDGLEVDYQLIKTYSRGAFDFIRKITRPVTGTVRVSLDGVEQIGGWTVDVTTGIVTFAVAPLGTVRVSAGYEFDVPCRFSSDVIAQSMAACAAGTFGSIPIEEIRE